MSAETIEASYGLTSVQQGMLFHRAHAADSGVDIEQMIATLRESLDVPRLIRAWELVEQPELRMCLELGQHGRYVYSVQPHSLFTGGIQFDVEQELEDQALWAGPQSTQIHVPGRHA